MLSKAVGARGAAARAHAARRGRGILGVSEATASRLFAGKYLLSPERAKEWELARCSCACSGRSTRCGATRRRRAPGSPATTSRWRPVPRPAALGRRDGPCRRVPGRRARSPLARPRSPATCGARSRRSTSSSTMALVDTLDEQHVLERLLDDGKPPVPDGRRALHYLLFTPFRYPPPPGGSRFRGPNDPGVFYARRRGPHRVRRAGLLALAPPARLAGAAVDADAAADGVPRQARRRARSTCATPPFARDRADVDRSRRLRAAASASARRRARPASAPSATNRCATRSTADAARC